MSRRIDVAGCVYHVWNRANAKAQLFHNARDYEAFESIVAEAKEDKDVRIYAYTIMPNHWHFVVEPLADGEIGRFFHWITITHAKRLHAQRGTEGQGHVYQGTYKANICQTDEHLISLIRYVERNALRANLVERAEDWRWSSAWRRAFGSEKEISLLDEWPIEQPAQYTTYLNLPQNEEELRVIRGSLRRGSPYGAGIWVDELVTKYGLEHTIRPRGRPPKHQKRL